MLPDEVAAPRFTASSARYCQPLQPLNHIEERGSI